MLNSKLSLNEGIFLKTTELDSTRAGFGRGLVKAAEKNKKVVVLTGDLRDSTKVDEFSERFPERFIEAGISEQNMAGMAAGMALSGKIPVMASFAAFSPGRNWEQIRVSISYSQTNVKIVGTHAGLSASSDGGTAQALEDIALMRVLPGMVVLNPIDSLETEKAVEAAIKHEGPVYLRCYREKTPVITTEKTSFKIGEACTLVEGKDVTIFGSGPITHEALVAAKELKGKHGISAEVISVSTIKPLDEKTILDSIKKTGRGVTLEEHNTLAGFGSAVAEVVSTKHPAPILRLGVDDEFGESGTYEDLKAKHKLKAGQIVEQVLKFIK
jgi:transketolase